MAAHAANRAATLAQPSQILVSRRWSISLPDRSSNSGHGESINSRAFRAAGQPSRRYRAEKPRTAGVGSFSPSCEARSVRGPLALAGMFGVILRCGKHESTAREQRGRAAGGPARRTAFRCPLVVSGRSSRRRVAALVVQPMVGVVGSAPAYHREDGREFR
jgi:hypothetical protein